MQGPWRMSVGVPRPPADISSTTTVTAVADRTTMLWRSGGRWCGVGEPDPSATLTAVRFCFHRGVGSRPGRRKQQHVEFAYSMGRQGQLTCQNRGSDALGRKDQMSGAIDIAIVLHIVYRLLLGWERARGPKGHSPQHLASNEYTLSPGNNQVSTHPSPSYTSDE